MVSPAEIDCAESWEIDQTAGTKTVDSQPKSGSGTPVFAAAMEWSLEDLPVGANVTKVELIINCIVAGGAAGLWDIHPYNDDGQAYPCDDNAATCWSRCHPAGTPYKNNVTDFRTTGLKSFTLGDGEVAQACVDVEAAKATVNRFSLAFHEEGDNDSYCQLDGSGGTAAVLKITYETAGLSVPVAMHHISQMTKIRRG